MLYLHIKQFLPQRLIFRKISGLYTLYIAQKRKKIKQPRFYIMSWKFFPNNKYNKTSRTLYMHMKHFLIKQGMITGYLYLLFLKKAKMLFLLSIFLVFISNGQVPACQN